MAEIQLPPAVLERSLDPLATGEQTVPRITRLTASGARQYLADGDERPEPLTTEVAGQAVAWTERRLVVRSRQLARAGARALRARVAQAQAAVAALNARGRGKRRFPERTALEAAVETLVTRDRVQGLLAVQSIARVHARQLRRDGSRPATVQVERDGRQPAVVNRQAVTTAISRLGWRVDATHAPPDDLSLAQAVLAYRSQYLVEREIGRLTGHPWSLPPMSLERDDHAIGVIRLLSSGLRVLTRLACVVRPRLAAARTTLAGLDVGNPKRATARPTTERLLQGFEGLTLTSIREGRRRRYPLPALARVQRRMLTLLNFPVDTYTRLCPDAHKPPSK